MTPPARAQAAIELLDEIVAAARDNGPAADTLIGRYFKTRRYAGAKDRRAVRELVYAAIRRAGDRPSSGRAALLGLVSDDTELAALFDGSGHGPAPIGPNEERAKGSVIPTWLAPRLAHLDADEQAALLARAPLDLRVNTLRATRDDVLGALPEAVPTALSPLGLRLPEGFAIEAHPLWRDGAVEVQDEGSQMIAAACEAAPGMTVVDLCAGAGGKTLALAAAMEGQGRLIACDTDRGRLSRLRPRAERAGVQAYELCLLDPGRERERLAGLDGQADIVLVDAPCSGSGTWRRNPESRWRLTPARLDTLVTLQRHVLELAVPLLKPGGRLVYAVCSLLDDEGADQFAAACARAGLTPVAPSPHAGRMRGDGVLLTPAGDGCDGFFVGAARRGG